MKVQRTRLGILLAISLWTASQAFGANELSRDVSVEDVVASPSSVQGRLANRQDGELRDVRILVTHAFHWADEMNPGVDNPSRTDVFTIPGPIGPRGSLTFEEKLVPPLPARADGHYVTSVEVLGFTQVGP
jgi:hypothetical protein